MKYRREKTLKKSGWYPKVDKPSKIVAQSEKDRCVQTEGPWVIKAWIAQDDHAQKRHK